MNRNFELPPSSGQSELAEPNPTQECNNSEQHEPLEKLTITRNDKQKFGKKALRTIRQEFLPGSKMYLTTKQLTQNLGVDCFNIGALLKTEGYEKCGIRLAKGFYFTEEDEKKIAAFFKDKKTARQLAQNLGVDHADISALLKTKGYEKCGIRLANSIYFTEEDEKKIAAFFEDKTTIRQLAQTLGVPSADISALLKTKGYEECVIRLAKGFYFTEEDEKKIAAFFEDKITIKQLARNLGTSPKDIGTLLKTDGYKNCGIRLSKKTYFTEEDAERVATFLKERKTTKQLAQTLGVFSADISALLKTDRYKDCGIKLAQGIYFTKRDAERVAEFFKDKKNTKQLAQSKDKKSILQLAQTLGISPKDIGALLKTDGYENCGIRLSRKTYFTEEDAEKVTEFFKDKKNTRQLAQTLGVFPEDIGILLKTKGYEDCGIKLAQGIYFTKRDAERVATFLKERKTTKQLAQTLGVFSADISALLKTDRYEDCGIRLVNGIYFSEEDAEKIADFFKERKTVKQLAQDFRVNPRDIGALLKTDGYEDCGLRLPNGIYLTKRDAERVATFLKERKTAKQLAQNIGVHHSDIGALLKTDGYENCGIRLSKRAYFTEEDAKKITAYFENKITITQLVREIGSNVIKVENIVQAHGIKGTKLANSIYYDKKQQIPEIIDLIERESRKDSFPETAFRFYLQQAGLKLSDKKFRPDWMRREETGFNLEIDIFIEFDNPPPPGIGIEYDGKRWHPSPEYDASKNDIAAKSGVKIIHIRENGCPPMRDDIPCIIRQDQKRSSLEDCIRQVFEMLHLPLPETGINVSKKGDKSKILELANRESRPNAYKGIQATDVNHDGVLIKNADAA